MKIIKVTTLLYSILLTPITLWATTDEESLSFPIFHSCKDLTEKYLSENDFYKQGAEFIYKEFSGTSVSPINIAGYLEVNTREIDSSSKRQIIADMNGISSKCLPEESLIIDYQHLSEKSINELLKSFNGKVDEPIYIRIYKEKARIYYYKEN